MEYPKCATEMRYFKEFSDYRDDWHEGYRCPECGTEREIPVVRLEEVAGGDVMGSDNGLSTAAGPLRPAATFCYLS